MSNIYVTLFALEIKSHICSDSDSKGNFLKINIFLYFYRYNIKFDNFSKNIQYADLGTATLRSQAIVEWSSAQHFPSKSSMFSSFAVKRQMYVQKCMQPSWKWNNHIKCPVQDIIQNFQIKCIFLENVDVTIQLPLHNKRISPIIFYEWIVPVDPGRMWCQSTQNIIITIWYWSLYFNVLICREMNYGQKKTKTCGSS
jgi:hypothetical protein